jgi:CheY-like chemotaxis protein
MIRVLVVDDDEVQLRATAALLQRAGYDVSAAHGGEEALALLAAREFDGAVVDLMMPRISGLELVRRLLARQPEVRVVLTSSYPLSPAQIARMGLGTVRFLPKNGPLPALLAALGGEVAPAPGNNRLERPTPTPAAPDPLARRY